MASLGCARNWLGFHYFSLSTIAHRLFENIFAYGVHLTRDRRQGGQNPLSAAMITNFFSSSTSRVALRPQQHFHKRPGGAVPPYPTCIKVGAHINTATLPFTFKVMKSDSSCVTPLTISVASLPHENGGGGRNARFLNNECMILVLSTCIKVQFRCWQKSVGVRDRKVASTTRSMQKKKCMK